MGGVRKWIRDLRGYIKSFQSKVWNICYILQVVSNSDVASCSLPHRTSYCTLNFLVTERVWSCDQETQRRANLSFCSTLCFMWYVAFSFSHVGFMGWSNWKASAIWIIFAYSLYLLSHWLSTGCHKIQNWHLGYWYL